MAGEMLGGAVSRFASASSICVAPTACSARITSSRLSRPCMRGRSRKLEVLTQTGTSAADSRSDPMTAASGSPAISAPANSRRERTGMMRIIIPSMVARRLSSMAGAIGAATLAFLVGTGAAPRPGLPACPERPTPGLSSQRPADVCIPDGFPGIALDYFDDYSWRSLVALVWPAAPGHRGVPASSKTIGTPGPRVFETYKPLWEIFHADGSAPASAFESYDAAAANPCAATAQFGDVTIGSASGIDDIGQAGRSVPEPPLRSP